MFDKLFRLTNPNMYQFTVQNSLFDISDYPELKNIGIWMELNKGVYKWIISNELLKTNKNLNNMNYVRAMFQVVTNLNDFEMERVYDVYYSPMWNRTDE